MRAAVRPLVFAVVLLGAAVAGPVVAQDCSKPRSGTERLICSNDRVAEAAEKLAFAFLNAYRRTSTDAERDAMRRAQREWESAVRDACADVPCLLRTYDERTLALEQN